MRYWISGLNSKAAPARARHYYLPCTPGLKLPQAKQNFLNNKVVKPHNGPSAILNLIAIGYCVVNDATGTGFYGFGINGPLVSNWL